MQLQRSHFYGLILATATVGGVLLLATAFIFAFAGTRVDWGTLLGGALYNAGLVAAALVLGAGVLYFAVRVLPEWRALAVPHGEDDQDEVEWIELVPGQQVRLDSLRAADLYRWRDRWMEAGASGLRQALVEQYGTHKVPKIVAGYQRAQVEAEAERDSAFAERDEAVAGRAQSEQRAAAATKAAEGLQRTMLDLRRQIGDQTALFARIAELEETVTELEQRPAEVATPWKALGKFIAQAPQAPSYALRNMLPLWRAVGGAIDHNDPVQYAAFKALVATVQAAQPPPPPEPPPVKAAKAVPVNGGGEGAEVALNAEQYDWEALIAHLMVV